MGCGGSKAVAPVDVTNATTERIKAQAAPSTVSKTETKAKGVKVAEAGDPEIPSLTREGTGLKFEVGVEAPKRKVPARFANKGKAEMTKEHLDAKAAQAARNRENQLANKVKQLELEDVKRRRAKMGLENKKNRAKAKIDEKQQTAIRKRDSELKKKRGSNGSLSHSLAFW